MTDVLSKRQQQAAATAEQLLAAAREVFESRGYVATTVGAITEVANTAHGTFYLYFRNKEDAFCQVVARAADDLYREATAPGGGDAYTWLEASIRGYLRVYSAHRGLWRCLLEGMHHSAAVEQMWLELRRPFMDRIERSLERLGGTGSIRPLDPRPTAHALGAMVEWSAFCQVELGEPGGPDVSLDGLARTLTDLWFHSLRAERTGSAD
jgi:AcrR family transcriptional regulator